MALELRAGLRCVQGCLRCGDSSCRRDDRTAPLPVTDWPLAASPATAAGCLVRRADQRGRCGCPRQPTERRSSEMPLQSQDNQPSRVVQTRCCQSWREQEQTKVRNLEKALPEPKKANQHATKCVQSPPYTYLLLQWSFPARTSLQKLVLVLIIPAQQIAALQVRSKLSLCSETKIASVLVPCSVFQVSFILASDSFWRLTLVPSLQL